MRIDSFACLVVAASLTACGSSADPTTSSTTSTSTATGAGGAATSSSSTGGNGGNGGNGAGGGAPLCSPTPGSTVIDDAYCDQIQLAVLAHAGQKTRVAIRGRLFTAPDACLRVDSVDVVRADATLVQSFPVGDVFLKSNDDVPWATGDAAAEISKPCADDAPRIEAFSVIVKGATDGGTFTAKCGAIEGGSSWPPRVRLTCHENLDGSARFASAYVSTNAMFTSTQLMMSFPESTPITAVDPVVHLIPATWMGAPIAPLDTTGWTSTISPSSGFLNVQLFQSMDPFGTTLCPTPPAMPDPQMPPPPLFLARITGQAAGAAFSSEVYVPNCMRIAM